VESGVLVVTVFVVVVVAAGVITGVHVLTAEFGCFLLCVSRGYTYAFLRPYYMSGFFIGIAE
jgi:hypothetical protein